MTDWELQGFAVQIVRDHLDKGGKNLMSWQGNPAVDPSIWFVGTNGREWVVVRAVRYPQLKADPPAKWQQIADRCARLGKVGHFASVSVAPMRTTLSIPAMLLRPNRCGAAIVCLLGSRDLFPDRQRQ